MHILWTLISGQIRDELHHRGHAWPDSNSKSHLRDLVTTTKCTQGTPNQCRLWKQTIKFNKNKNKQNQSKKYGKESNKITALVGRVIGMNKADVLQVNTGPKCSKMSLATDTKMWQNCVSLVNSEEEKKGVWWGVGCTTKDCFDINSNLLFKTLNAKTLCYKYV